MIDDLKGRKHKKIGNQKFFSFFLIIFIHKFIYFSKFRKYNFITSGNNEKREGDDFVFAILFLLKVCNLI